MERILKALCLIPLISGATLLALGLWRCRLPYENDRYFDPQTDVVYHLQTAEIYTLIGGVLTFVGLLIAIAGFIALRRNHPSHSQ